LKRSCKVLSAISIQQCNYIREAQYGRMYRMKAELIDHMGSDLTVVNAARVSFDKESTDVGSSGDAKLINYLATHGHWTPFSHPQITMRYTVPIFVARQEFKHIVGFTRNEVSRRFVDNPPEFYVPKVWRSRPEGSVKQGSGGPFTELLYTKGEDGFEATIEEQYEVLTTSLLEIYQRMIGKGVAPEQARMVLPQSMYTSYYVTGSLAAFARFVKQRSDPHAQVEIQELAQEVSTIISPLYPVSWQALVGDKEDE
jgi:thymidylate synthase (FAD)